MESERKVRRFTTENEYRVFRFKNKCLHMLRLNYHIDLFKVGVNKTVGINTYVTEKAES